MATTMTSHIDREQLTVHQIEKQYPSLEKHKSKLVKTIMTSCTDHVQQAVQQIQ